MNTSSDRSSLKNYFLNILVKKDYSYKELFDKGVLKGFDIKQIEQIIDELISRNFLNDLRLAQNIVDSYKGKKGKMWLKQKLTQRKVSSDSVQKVLSNLESIPDDNLKQKIAKKYGVTDWRNLETSQKQKILQYLERQGFTDVWKMLKDWMY